MILQNESGNKYYNITINKTSVEEGIDEELKNILQTCASLDQQNFIKVKELKEISLEKLIELGQVDWKKVYVQLQSTEPFYTPVAIDLLISHEHYLFPKENFPKNVEFCSYWNWCGILKLKNRNCKNCVEMF